MALLKLGQKYTSLVEELEDGSDLMQIIIHKEIITNMPTDQSTTISKQTLGLHFKSLIRVIATIKSLEKLSSHWVSVFSSATKVIISYG